MREQLIPEEIIGYFSQADDVFKSFKTSYEELEQAAETLLQTELPTNKAFHHSLISRLLEDSYQINFLYTNKIDYIRAFLQRFELDLLFDSNSSNLVQTCFNIFYAYVNKNQSSEALLQMYNELFDEIYKNLPALLENEYAAKFLRSVYAVELGIQPESLKHQRRRHANDQILRYLEAPECRLQAKNLSRALMKFCAGVGFKQAAKVLETSYIMQLYLEHFQKIYNQEMVQPCQIMADFLGDSRWEEVLAAYRARKFDATLYEHCREATLPTYQALASDDPETLHFIAAACSAPQNCYYAAALLSHVKDFQNLRALQLDIFSACVRNSHQYKEAFVPNMQCLIGQTEAILTEYDYQSLIESAFLVLSRTKDMYGDLSLYLAAELKKATGSEQYFLKRLLHPGAADNAPLQLQTFKNNQRFNFSVLNEYGDAETLRKLKKEAWVKVRQLAKQQRYGDAQREKSAKYQGCYGFWRCGELIALAMLKVQQYAFIEAILPALQIYFAVEQQQILQLIDNPAGVDLVCQLFRNKAIPFALKAAIIDKLRGQFRELCFSKLGLLFLGAVGEALMAFYSADVPIELQVDIMRLIATEIRPRAVVLQLQRREEGMTVFRAFRMEAYLSDAEQWEKGLFSALKVLERKEKRRVKEQAKDAAEQDDKKEDDL